MEKLAITLVCTLGTKCVRNIEGNNSGRNVFVFYKLRFPSSSWTGQQIDQCARSATQMNRIFAFLDRLLTLPIRDWFPASPAMLHREYCRRHPGGHTKFAQDCLHMYLDRPLGNAQVVPDSTIA